MRSTKNTVWDQFSALGIPSQKMMCSTLLCRCHRRVQSYLIRMYYLDPLGYVGQHYQPSNMFVAKKIKSTKKKAKQKHMKMQKQRNLLCFCNCVVFFCFVSWDHFCTYENFYPSAIFTLLGKKCENRATTNAKIKKKSEKKRQTRTATCFCLFVCFTFCCLFAFLLYKIILAPCIYGWRARHNPRDGDGSLGMVMDP